MLPKQEILNALKGALKLLKTEEVWTQGEFARSARTGRGCSEFGDVAGSFCLLGAVNRAAGQDNFSTMNAAETRLGRSLEDLGILVSSWEFASVTRFNDSPDTKLADVRRVLKHAIKQIKVEIEGYDVKRGVYR